MGKELEDDGEKRLKARKHLGDICSNPVDSMCSVPFSKHLDMLPRYPFSKELFFLSAGNTSSRHQLSAPSGMIWAAESCLPQGHAFLVTQRPIFNDYLLCEYEGLAICAQHLTRLDYHSRSRAPRWVIWGNLWASITIQLLSLFSYVSLSTFTGLISRALLKKGLHATLQV